MPISTKPEAAEEPQGKRGTVLDLALIADQLIQVDLTPFLLAIAVGAAIGLEREIHGRPAGLRTHTLVCLSSTILIHASQGLPLTAGDASLVERLVYDPNRLGSGIVTGIGFLGAAAVIRSGDIVRGITTGACVWSVACLGVVIGQGHYGIALVAALAMVLILVAFDNLLNGIKPVIYRCLVIRGERAALGDVRQGVEAVLRDRRIKIQDLSCRITSPTDPFQLVIHVRCRNQFQATDVIEGICSLEAVTGADWRHVSG